MTLTPDAPPPTGPPARAALAGVHAAIDDLAGSVADADDGVLVADCERAIRRLQAVKLRLIAAADRNGVAAGAGLASTGAWVAQQVNDDQAESARSVRLATALERASSVLGAAIADGAISTEHAAVVVRAVEDLPSGLSDTQRLVVEQSLVEKARRLSPTLLRRAARRAVAAVEPDEHAVDAHEDALVAAEEERARQRSRLTLHDNSDGTVTGHFTVPTFHGHLLRKVIDTITAPRRARLGATAAQVGDRADRLDWDRARGQAFCELIEHLPTDRLHGKTAATIVVTLAEDALRERVAVGRLDTGEALSAGEVRRLACAAGVVPAVLGGRSLPLDLGRSQRLFTEAQRTALATTHTTCAADGCERPFAWTEIHHRRPWSAGGRTDLDNAVPLCHFHHRRVHDPGFTHQLGPDGATFRRCA